MSDYPEINALRALYQKHHIEVSFSDTDFLAGSKDYRRTKFVLDGKTFSFYVEDERDDAAFNNPLLNLCLVLRELEGYEDATDYLVWCKERYIDPKEENALANYRDLADIYRDVEKILGEVNSQVSNWDFEMRSGSMWKLNQKE